VIDMKRILEQARKELIQFHRDKRALFMALGIPVILFILMTQSISLTVNDLPILVQDFDGSMASQQFIDAFRASITFRVIAWPIDKHPEDAFQANAARAALIIPKNFSRDMARGQGAPVQMLVDGSDSNTARLVSTYANQVANAYNQSTGALTQRGPIRPAIRVWYNPGRSSNKFYGPGIFVLMLSLFPPLLASLAMAKEGEEKTILQVYVSSISAHEFLLGKILASMVIGLAQWLVLMAVLFGYFDLRLAGDPTPFLVGTFLYIFCAAAFGTMVGAAIPEQASAMQAVALFGFLLVFLLAGLIFPVENIPIAVRWISNIVWGRYYIELIRDALLQGGGWPAMWSRVAAIGGIGALMYLIAWRKMRHMQLEA
jgi:ABC-2 type transport system permease protein